MGRDADGSSFGRESAIAMAEVAARVTITPVVLAYRLRLIAFESVGEALSLVPGAVGRFLRRAWYGVALERCGRRLYVHFGTVIRYPGTRIGHDCDFGPHNRVGLADVGDNYLSSDHVSVVSGRRQHGYSRRDVPISRQPGEPRRIVIGPDVWAGSHATIAADVAPHTVIGATATVTETFPEWSIIGGVPAKVIGTRP